MNELDPRKLYVTRKYLIKKEKIETLLKAQTDFLLIMLMMIVAIVGITLITQVPAFLIFLTTCVIPSIYIGIAQVQKNLIKKDCLDGAMDLKSFNKFLKSEECKLYIEYIEKENEKNNQEYNVKPVNFDSSSQSVHNMDHIIVSTNNKNNNNKKR